MEYRVSNRQVWVEGSEYMESLISENAATNNGHGSHERLNNTENIASAA